MMLSDGMLDAECTPLHRERLPHAGPSKCYPMRVKILAIPDELFRIHQAVMDIPIRGQSRRFRGFVSDES